MSRSRTIGSRFPADMHSFLLHCKTARTSCKASILFTDSQAKISFTFLLHTCAMQCTIQKVLFLDFVNAKSLITSSKSTERSMSASMQSRDRVQSLLTHRCSVRVLDSSEYSVQALMVNADVYCPLCIVLQQSNIIFCFLKYSYALCCVMF